MGLVTEVRFLLQITHSQEIARRYLVTNGFDGALTMLGLVVGFHVSGEPNFSIVLSVCLAAAIALGMSGISSAYISESAERKKELTELEQAMVTELGNSAHGRASRLVPIMIAIVNGLAPVLISLFILAPIWLANHGALLPLNPMVLSIIVAFLTIFFLGVFLGRTTGEFWLWTGLRTLLIALVTSVLILVIS